MPGLKLFITLVLALFFSESLIMVSFIYFLPHLSPMEAVFFDIVLLIFALFPVLYYFVFQNYSNEIKRRKKLEEELKNANEVLESEVKNRTAELKKANEQLQKTVKDLEKWKKLTVDRELRMRELKKEISKLKNTVKDKS